MSDVLKRLPAVLFSRIAPNFSTFLATQQLRIWLMALAVGITVSIAAIAFREVIGLVQLVWLLDKTENVATAAKNIHWLLIIAAPTLGGLLVGWLLQRFTVGRRAAGVADAIEACAKGGRPLDLKDGLWSAVITALSLGFGASSGREGPMVHLGATLATSISRLLSLPDQGRRTLFACGVAGAVSASFNAPIAGVLFAHEVILSHYSKRAFIPIVISSVAGTILTRVWFGDVAAFVIPEYQITSFLEFPAFALLGVVSALIAVIFQYSLVGTDYVARSIQMPLWIRPAVGGLIIGLIGVFYPEILGVGYEATNAALQNSYEISLLLILLVLKTAATAITLASRFGGGVFSPSLFLGAMGGGAFGLIAAGFFPEMASSQGLYSILGMGAVAAAVLGAPFSTVVIAFELTGGYSLSIALLLTVSISVGINQALHGRSFFQWQLEMRGHNVEEGPHYQLMESIKAKQILLPLDEDEKPEIDDEDATPLLTPESSLRQVLRAFDESGVSRLRVVANNQRDQQIGWITHVDALRLFNNLLIDTSDEEHK